MEQDLGGRYQVYQDGRMTSETIDDIASDWVREMAIHTDMVIDLSGVEYIDLAGLQLMLHIRERAELVGKHIDFIGDNPAVNEAVHVFHQLVHFLGWTSSPPHLNREDGAA